jgi:hypothetical protein
MASGQFEQAFRERWLDDKRGKRDILLSNLEVETDPKARNKLAARIARYRALITLGPEGASLAAERAAAARGPARIFI